MDRTGASDGDGVRVGQLKSGEAGRSKAGVKAKGSNLSLHTLPLSMPFLVQLRASNGMCIGTIFSTLGVQQNDSVRFKGKAD